MAGAQDWQDPPPCPQSAAPGREGTRQVPDRLQLEHVLCCPLEVRDPPWAEQSSTRRLSGTEPASTPSTPSPRPRAGAFPRSRGLREPHPISSSSPVRSTSQQHGRSSRARSHLVPRDHTALGWLPRGSLHSPHSLPPRPTQVDLPHRAIPEASSKKFEDALSLIHSAWQRSDSLCRGRASRDPWC